VKIWTAVGAALLCAACASAPTATSNAVGPRAQAKLEARSGSAVEGVVAFRPADGGLVAEVDIRGLTPNSEHGFHVHEKGDCSAPDASSAGGHFNPGGQPHGMPGSGAHHAGDIQNLRADANGAVRTEVKLPGLTIVGGPTSIIGRAVVVHRDPDDYTSQPAGNSGPRIACGVITAQP
jgi:Cu-Zn family superoxide dismutase